MFLLFREIPTRIAEQMGKITNMDERRKRYELENVQCLWCALGRVKLKRWFLLFACLNRNFRRKQERERWGFRFVRNVPFSCRSWRSLYSRPYSVAARPALRSTRQVARGCFRQGSTLIAVARQCEECGKTSQAKEDEIKTNNIEMGSLLKFTFSDKNGLEERIKKRQYF